jgi:hypothetical protein
VKLQINDDRQRPNLIVTVNLEDENKTQISGILAGKDSLKPIHDALKYLFYEPVAPLTEELRNEIHYLINIKKKDETVELMQDVLKKLLLAYENKAKEPKAPTSKD